MTEDMGAAAIQLEHFAPVWETSASSQLREDVLGMRLGGGEGMVHHSLHLHQCSVCMSCDCRLMMLLFSVVFDGWFQNAFKRLFEYHSVTTTVPLFTIDFVF